ncbi:MAG TPA: hypothetical protein DEQ02_00360 [Ruminococcaceae bacterium]|nr:hypothetical protein [Oscillospiraceae bacterium]
MTYQRIGYTTGDRSLQMDFVFMDGGPAIGWRIYIINRMDYKARNTSFHATHRLHTSGETYDYICWAGRIATFEQAKAVASLWSDATALYIRSGVDFDEIVKRLLKSNEE